MRGVWCEVIMKWWVEQLPRLKWLRPGMGVKRWVLLLFIGLALLVLAVAAVSRAVELTLLWALVQRLHLQRISPLLEAFLFFAAGSALVTWAVFSMNRSLLSAFRHTDQAEVADIIYRHRQRQRGPKVAAIGGGHGLNTLLRGLKEYTDNITAIVTVADDGGSSGRLRRDLGMLPPGDFRNCIAALSDAEGLVTQLFQYRFGDETDLDGHSFGNLYLTAMAAITGSFEGALEESSRVLAVRGRVIPSTLAQVTLCAEVLVPGATSLPLIGDSRTEHRTIQVRGESSIGQAGRQIQRVYLDPEEPPAYPKAIRAILEADLIMIGPGSLYTSVLPNLLVPDLAQAIVSAQAPKVYICNVATQAGETEGYDVASHVKVLRQHVGDEMFTIVLANHTFGSSPPPGLGVDWVRLPKAETKDYQLITRDLVDIQYPWRHDSRKLAQALMELVGG
jgi:uncharacterized cofD-like protein